MTVEHRISDDLRRRGELFERRRVAARELLAVAREIATSTGIAGDELDQATTAAITNELVDAGITRAEASRLTTFAINAIRVAERAGVRK